jgi:hypothetical protein
MSTTLIPDPRDASVDTATDMATVIDFTLRRNVEQLTARLDHTS